MHQADSQSIVGEKRFWQLLSRNVKQSGLGFLLLCSVCLNFLLSNRVSDLKERMYVLKSEQRLVAGTFVPPIKAKGLDGQDVTISYTGDGVSTILYVFAPDCGWCKRNIANVKMLASSVSPNLRFIGLSLAGDGLREYMSQNDLGFPVCWGITDDVKAAYKMGGTPQTILISDQGRVLKNWMGAYSGELKKEIEAYLSITLPGVTNPPE
jgi:hypothetical protein